MKKLLFAALTALVLLAGCSKPAESEPTATPEATATPEVTATPEASATPEGSPVATLYVDGTYEGTAKGHNDGDLNVTVVVTGGMITEVTVGDHTETAGIADPAIKDIPAAIVAANSTVIDAVAGATVTSKAIIAAVDAALANAVAE